jgi:hypothetical protein
MRDLDPVALDFTGIERQTRRNANCRFQETAARNWWAIRRVFLLHNL